MNKIHVGNREHVREAVRKEYAAIARSGGSCAPGVASRGKAAGCGPTKSCCGSSSPNGVAKAVGYSDAELATLPEGANMGLSCGNPTALAALRTGEVVLDLGSGGGFDVFLAAQKVGPKGRVIGVDMTPEMLRKAGFADVRIALNEASRAFIKDWDPGTGVENYICSAFIEARK